MHERRRRQGTTRGGPAPDVGASTAAHTSRVASALDASNVHGQPANNNNNNNNNNTHHSRTMAPHNGLPEEVAVCLQNARFVCPRCLCCAPDASLD